MVILLFVSSPRTSLVSAMLMSLDTFTSCEVCPTVAYVVLTGTMRTLFQSGCAVSHASLLAFQLFHSWLVLAGSLPTAFSLMPFMNVIRLAMLWKV